MFTCSNIRGAEVKTEYHLFEISLYTVQCIRTGIKHADLVRVLPLRVLLLVQGGPHLLAPFWTLSKLPIDHSHSGIANKYLPAAHFPCTVRERVWKELMNGYCAGWIGAFKTRERNIFQCISANYWLNVK